MTIATGKQSLNCGQKAIMVIISTGSVTINAITFYSSLGKYSHQVFFNKCYEDSAIQWVSKVED